MVNQSEHTSKKILGTSMGRKFTKIRQVFIILVFVFSLIGVNPVKVGAAITFTGTELLGRPEADRISISCVPASAARIRYQYSTTSGGPWTTSSYVDVAANVPAVVTITGLTANTKYYYQMQYSTDSGSTWTTRSQNSFQTQRAKGTTFTFDVTSDNHVNIMLGNSTNWTSTMNRIVADAPDFNLDLGDTFAMDNGTTSVTLGDTASAEAKYTDQLQYFNIFSGSSAVFLTAGNHEQQEAWHLQGTLANSLPVMGKNAEKKFFLNPVTDGFYSADTTTQANLSGDHLIDDYYAWTWGDALFVVISPYWTTTTKPYTTTVGGGETDATGSGNRWDWTLGLTQYNWLKSVLSGSNAKYKFVFSHQMATSNGMTSPVNQVNYGHGGVDADKYTEWGGYDADGTTYSWATNRPSSSGWGSQPIAQMMQTYGVSAFFHGHDHQMAYEKDGFVYQAVPSGSFAGSFGNYTTGGNSGKTIYADSSQTWGHLKVTVSSSQATVDYYQQDDTSPDNTYTIAPNAVVTSKAPDDFDGDGKSDPVKYTTSTHTLAYLKSSDGTWGTVDMGTDVSSYVPRSDFDGDGKTDPAKFVTASNSVWYIKSSTSAWAGVYTGPGSYTYVSGADYDGDGKTDPAIFLSTNALWYFKSSTSAWGSLYEGPGTYTLVKGSDFDGDGKTDPAHFVTSNNALWYQKSSTSTWQGVYMGPGTYTYVAGSDFDGDGKTDPATFNSSTNTLWYLQSSNSTWVGVYLGSGTFTYVAGCDFDGDGKTDPAEFVSSTHMLWYKPSSGGAWVGKDMGTGSYDVVN